MNCIPSIFCSLETRRAALGKSPFLTTSFWSFRAVAVAICVAALPLHAQSTKPEAPSAVQQEPSPDLQQRVVQLEAEVSELKTLVKQLASGKQTADDASAASIATEAPARAGETASRQNFLTSDDRKTLDFLHGTTINFALNTYYEYNFNHPVGRVNLLGLRLTQQ